MTEQTGIQAKFYFSIENGLHGEELEAFCEVMCKYFIEHYKINEINGKDLFIGLIKDHSDITNFFSEISQYNPIQIGLYKQDGLPVGVELVNVGTKEEPSYEEQGTPELAFNSTEYISLMPDDVEYDNNGEVVSTSRPTVARPLSGFAGWKTESLN